MADWKARLLLEHIEEARFIVEQLLRSTPITVWHGTAGAFATFVRRGLGGSTGQGEPGTGRHPGFEASVHLAGMVEGLECGRYLLWLRGGDLNPRPLGYEPNELPDCSTPRHESFETFGSFEAFESFNVTRVPGHVK